MKLSLILTIVFLSQSCVLFDFFDTKSVSKNYLKEIPKICLSSQGGGRLIISDHKFRFKFQSAMLGDEGKWVMSMVFPLYGEETFTVDWDDKRILSFEASFENKILQDKNKIDPEKLHSFLEKWAQLIIEIHRVQTNKKYKTKFKWDTTPKKLAASSSISKTDSIILEFKNLTSENYFGRYDVFTRSEEGKPVKLELIVRKCLEKSE